MIKALISDFSKVLLFRKDNPELGKLNNYHKELLKKKDYDFWQYFILNTELLDFYKQLSSSLDMYIFTTKYIQEYPPVQKKLKSAFRKIFSAIRLGIKKDKPEAYLKLIDLLKLAPEEILFIDDTQANIEAAKKAGLKTIHFTDTKSIINRLGEIL